MATLVLGDPFALIIIGLIATHYLNGYVALGVMAILFANVLGYGFYAPLTVVVESKRRIAVRRALLLLLQVSFIVFLVWILLL